MIFKYRKYTFSRNFLISLILPIFMVFYLLYLGAADGHKSLTGIDGEYVYLLNGLNISTFQFKNIGFTDHPGTPFLVLTGVFIKLSHLLFGQGNIIDDVITRPDFYLKACSMFMLGLSSLILIWGGKKIIDKTKSITAMIFIQGTYFLSEIVLSMQLRFIVDRLLPLVAFIFSVYTILFLYNEISERKYAIFSGLILGFGFIAKFNFVVIAFIPPLILNYKYWIRYVSSFLIAAFLSFLPVIDKFGNAKKFILQLFLNKGTYGGGERGIIDSEMFLSTFGKLYEYGENFLCFFAFALASVFLYLLFKKGKKENRKKALFFAGFLVASILMVIMISKNFKSYYLIPTLGISGIATFLALQFLSYYSKLNKLLQTFIAIVVFGYLFIPIIGDLNNFKEFTKQKQKERLETRRFIDNNIASGNFWFLEPGWISGPFEINGLLWGISYVAGKNDFTENYMKLNPCILTYEGDNRPIKHFRTRDAEIDKIFNENTPVYLFSTPGRRTHLLQQELTNQSESLNLKVSYDTIYTNNENNDRVIKASFHQKHDTVTCTAITTFNNLEGEYPFWKQNSVTEELAYSSNKSSKINREYRSSPVYRKDSIPQFTDNLNSIVVSCKYFQIGKKNRTRLVIDLININEERFLYTVPCRDYFNKLETWDDFEYKLYVPKRFRGTESLNTYFYNTSKEAVYLDDIKVTLNIKP